MATGDDVLQAAHAADEHARRVIATFMKLTGVSQERLGNWLGLTQSQVSRRLRQGLSYQETEAVARFFGVHVATLALPTREAVAALYATGFPGLSDLGESSSGWAMLTAAHSELATAV